MKRIFRAALIAGAFCLSACATLSGHAPQGTPDETAWQARLTRLGALGSWELSGRVGVITAKDGGSGSLDWKQQGPELTFDFRGPLGTGAIHMQGDAAALHIQSSRGDDFITGSDPELPQRQMKGAGAAGDAQGMLDPDEPRNRLFKFHELGAENVATAVDDIVEGLVQAGPELVNQPSKIGVRDLKGSH